MAQDKKFDAMEYIWERLPKEKGGLLVRYIAGDIPYLYYYGFVDTKKYSMEEWKRAFEPFKQADGAFILTKPQFLALRVFRYNAPVKAPFEAHQLRPGPWPDKELKYLYDKSLAECTVLPENIFWNAVKALKARGKQDKAGNLVIDDEAKKQFGYLVDRFPTPRRNLEKEVVRLRQEKMAQQTIQNKNRNATVFTIGQSEKEYQVESLQKLQSSRDTSTVAPSGSGENVDLKSLQKQQKRPPTGKLMG